MKATRIRRDKKKISERELQELCETIVRRAEKSGFYTDAQFLGATSIKIGLHMCSFRINTDMLGYNVCVSKQTISGYKKTNVPNWNQRVEFNNLVNKAFTDYGLDANIVSGNFTVRDYEEGAITSWSGGGDRGGYFNDQSDRYFELDDSIKKEMDEAKKVYLSKSRITRNLAAKERRDIIKSLKEADYILFESYKYASRKHSFVNKVISFEEFLAERKEGAELGRFKPLYGKNKKEALAVYLVTERMKGQNNESK